VLFQNFHKFNSSGSWRKSKEMKRFQDGILAAHDAGNGCNLMNRVADLGGGTRIA
jgi:hypothetical protein